MCVRLRGRKVWQEARPPTDTAINTRAATVGANGLGTNGWSTLKSATWMAVTMIYHNMYYRLGRRGLQRNKGATRGDAPSRDH